MLFELRQALASCTGMTTCLLLTLVSQVSFPMLLNMAPFLGDGSGAPQPLRRLFVSYQDYDMLYIRIELGQALISYQDQHMLLLTLAGAPEPAGEEGEEGAEGAAAEAEPAVEGAAEVEQHTLGRIHTVELSVQKKEPNRGFGPCSIPSAFSRFRTRITTCLRLSS